jgi:putative lysine transport system substrate-binding protein
MKKLARILAIALAVAALFAVAGCSSGSNSKQLRVGMECAYAPFNWTQATDANNAVKIADSNEYCNGYDVQMAKKIADSLGYELEVHKTEWTGIPAAIASGKIDAGVCGMTVNTERKKAFDFSDPYYLADFVVLTKKDGKFANATSIADLKGAACTSQQSTAWYDLLTQIPEGKIQPAIADVPTMLVALGSGKCEIETANKPTGLAAVKADPSLKMIVFEGDKGFKIDAEQTHVCVAVKKGNDELREKINKALASISETDRNKMMDEAIANEK